jgi:SAM-dependent methyltransferase
MNYYNKHAKEYINNTKDVDMKEYYDIFESYLNPNSKILDVGFGSGRDSLYFKNKGYEVYSIDPIKEFCDNAKELGLTNVYPISIEDIEYNNEFDGIWACASLLHLESNKLVDVFNKCYRALKDNGVMYVSFKYGEFAGIIDDRYFTYLVEESFINIINQTKFKIDKLWITEDKLNRDVKWLNVILKKK